MPPAQVFDDGKDGTRFNWTIDLLPNELAPYISGQMDLGVAAMQKALGKEGGVANACYAASSTTRLRPSRLAR